MSILSKNDLFIERTEKSETVDSQYLWYKSWPKGVRKSLNYPEVSLHQLFEESVKKNGERTYLSILGKNFSYNLINDQANKFAYDLKAKGIGLGDKVGIILPNLPQFVIAFFGILKVGATVVPFSPLYGKLDLLNLVHDSEITALVALDLVFPKIEEILPECPYVKHIYITTLGDLVSPILAFIAKIAGKIPKSPKISIPYEKFYNMIKNSPPIEKSLKIEPKETIAVIGYTGGTTGKPKGAMLTHYNLVANLHQGREWARIVHPLGVHKKFVGAVPFFHIIGLNAVMLVAMFYDSTIYLFPDPRKYESIMKTIEKEKIQYFHGVPTLYKALMNHPNFKKYDLSSLELIFSGAAPLPVQLGKDLEQATGAMVIEAYGMTETSPMVSANPFERENHKFGSIGIPFPDTVIKIVDLETEKEVPQGKIGEIIIKGPQIMKGYLKRLEATAKTLRNGYLHTGDMARFDENGFIQIVNRQKDMINASGYKIYPSELEGMIVEAFPELLEAVVTATPDEYRGESVKIIAVLKKGAQLTKEKIINFFKENVAKYKVPKEVEFREELPKTNVGKIDRKALREAEFSDPTNNHNNS